MSDRVRELIEERIDGEIHSILWHSSNSGTAYGLVASERDNATVSLTTIILDSDDETLRIHGDNSMWLPADGAVLDGTIRSIARTCNGVTESIEDDDPMEDSLIGIDAEEIGEIEIEDDYDPADSETDWKADSGADEMDMVHTLLRESPVDNADRLIRLSLDGDKSPWSGEPQRVMRGPESIGGNYGIEVSEDDDLIILDIDDMEEAPVSSMPETMRSESPHGGEHRFYLVPQWQQHFQDRFGVDNPHPSWGEIRSQDGYVVGPGSELTTCKHGCCTEDDPGTYDLDEHPIETVSAEEIGDLIAPYREGSQ